MKKTIILLSVICLFYLCISDMMVKSLEIPDDAIRIRVVPNTTNNGRTGCICGRYRRR